MKDEKYAFIQEVREKKVTARSSRNKKTTSGRGGSSVKFPSDYLTAKELKAMNGETKTYRMNDPMTWAEFQALPDDLKIVYIKALRDKYNVPYKKIAEMLGVSISHLSKEIIRLGLSAGRGGGVRTNWDQDGWAAFLGMPTMKEAAQAIKEAPVQLITEETQPQISFPMPSSNRLIPDSGTLSFVGSTESVVGAILQILGGAAVQLTVSWQQLATALSEECKDVTSDGN